MTKWDPHAYALGITAQRLGWSIDDNPYSLDTDPFLYDSWQEGWIKEDQKDVKRR